MRWIHPSIGLVAVVASQCALAQGSICSPNPCVDPPMRRPVPAELLKPASPRVITAEEMQKLGFVTITGIKADKDKQPAEKQQPAKPDEKASGAKKDASRPTDK